MCKNFQSCVRYLLVTVCIMQNMWDLLWAVDGCFSGLAVPAVLVYSQPCFCFLFWKHCVLEFVCTCLFFELKLVGLTPLVSTASVFYACVVFVLWVSNPWVPRGSGGWGKQLKQGQWWLVSPGLPLLFSLSLLPIWSCSAGSLGAC